MDVVGAVGASAEESLVEAIADRVMEKLRVSEDTNEVAAVHTRDDYNWHYSQNSRPSRRNTRGNGRDRGRSQIRNNATRKCRSCGRTDHLIKDCPEKFCEACGQRGAGPAEAAPNSNND